jgi:hypothetical protein
MKTRKYFLVALLLTFGLGQNVGIGTNAPTQRLHVAGNLRLDGAFMPGNQAGAIGNILLSQGAGTPPVWLPNGAVGTILMIGPGGTPIWAPNPICASPTQDRHLRVAATAPTLSVCNSTLAENATGNIWNADGSGGPVVGGDKFAIIANGTFPYAINGYATTGTGVYGQATGANGRGVYGQATGSDGIGVLGTTNQITGIGVQGVNTSTSPGVVGRSGGVATYYIYTAGSFGNTGHGIIAFSTGGTGTGVVGAGNGQVPQTYGNGAGGAFTGTNVGSFSVATDGAGTGVSGAGNNLAPIIFPNGAGGAFTGTNLGSGSVATNANGIGVYGEADVNNGVGVYGRANANNGRGVVGVADGSVGRGVYGQANAANGIGVYGTTNNVTGYGVVGYHAANLGNRFAGLFSEAGGSFCFIGGVAGGMDYKILSPGTASTIVDGTQGKQDKRIMFCPEMPEIFFMDVGQGQLQNGRAYITLDPIFAKNIVVNSQHPLRVIIQLEDECNGVRVTNKSQNGFEVVELHNGTSNARFTYFVIANRANRYKDDGTLASKHEGVRFPPAPEPPPIPQLPPPQIVEMKPVEQQAISLEAKEVRPVKLKLSSKE